MPQVRVRLAPLLYSYTGGLKVIEVEAATVGSAIAELDRRYPGIAFRVIDEQGQIRQHMNIFLGEDKAYSLETPVVSGNEIFIVGALSGG